MEIEQEIPTTYNITAKQLYERFESWNDSIADEINIPKKGKRNFYKVKDLLIKFNKFPTPIENLELIDIKLGSRVKEDDIFLEKDFIVQHLRRGESLFYNKAENTYDYARIGLPKFFDYQKSYKDTEKENKLKERVLGNIISFGKEQKNSENLKYYAYLTTKVNGENFQVSYNTKYDCWVIASKNVSIAIRNKEDLEFYKNEKNFEGCMQEGSGPNQFLNEKERKKKENKDKKKEKKKKKQERIERRKKGKEQEKVEDDNEEEKEDEKDDNSNPNKINLENNNGKKKKEMKNILERYSFAVDFGEIWLKILDEKITKNNLLDEFKKELGNHTLIGESVGDKKREHILVYKERDIIFYGIVNNQKLLSEYCLPLSSSFDLFKKFNLSSTNISPSAKFNSLDELLLYINEQYDIIFDKSLQESGEGNVVYFSCDVNGSQVVKGLGKLKTFEYRFLRKIREKTKGVPAKVDAGKIEGDINAKISKNNKKKEKRKKGKDNDEINEVKEKMKINKMMENEMKKLNEEREKKINNLINKMIKESKELLQEVPNSKYNLDKNLQKEYFDFGEYIINYKAQDDTNYSDVFASFIEIMKDKFKAKTPIEEKLINEIKQKFEGLISKEKKEENDEGDGEEDQKDAENE